MTMIISVAVSEEELNVLSQFYYLYYLMFLLSDRITFVVIIFAYLHLPVNQSLVTKNMYNSNTNFDFKGQI